MMDWLVLAMKAALILLSAFFAFELWRALRTGVVSLNGNRRELVFGRKTAPRPFWLVVSFHGLMFAVTIMLITDLLFGLDLRFWL